MTRIVRGAWFPALLGAGLLLWAAGAWAQAARDVKCDKCVQAGDIANGAVVKRAIKKGAVVRNRIAKGAVNSAKLADDAVSSAKLADGAVDGARLAVGAVSGIKIAPGAVGGAALADGAVGAADLAAASVSATALADGAVGSGKLADSAIAGTELPTAVVSSAAILDGAVTNGKLAPQAITPAKLAPGVEAVELLTTVVVSPVGPASTDNCTALMSALAAITDASASKRYTIKLEPGIYNCGATPLVMKQFVDIEGSGETTTVITGNPTGIGVVNGNDFSELRFVTVEHTGGGGFATAINTFCCGNMAAAFKMNHVTAMIQGSSDAQAIHARGTAVLRNVTATATSTASPTSSPAAVGIFTSGPTTVVQFENVTAVAGGPAGDETALFNQGPSTVTARNSVLSALEAIVIGGTANLIATQLDGTILDAGTENCVGAYDGSFAELDNSCLPIP